MVEASANNSPAADNQNGNDDNGTASQAIIKIPPTSILNKRHPLKNRWTLWFLNNKKDLDWLDRLTNVCTLSTVEDFWTLYDNIRPPSVLMGCDYNLFKKGIEPIWEVAENKNGGRLVVLVEKNRVDVLDAWWLELLLSLIGEGYGEVSDYICGAVCNIRQKGSKISLWTKDSMKDDVNRRIGGIMKQRLQSNPIAKNQFKISYEDHSDVQNKQSSAVTSRLIIQ